MATDSGEGKLNSILLNFASKLTLLSGKCIHTSKIYGQVTLKAPVPAISSKLSNDVPFQ